MTSTDNDRDPHKLCLACGLCCNGAWFGHGVLDADEVDRAGSVGMKVRRIGDKDYFAQPCSKHVNGCCSVYENWRPRVCDAFTCNLLNRFLSGEVDESEAMGHIASARALFDRIVLETGELSEGLWGGAVMQRLGSVDGESASSLALPPLSPEVTMDVVALKVYLQRHFVKHEDGA